MDTLLTRIDELTETSSSAGAGVRKHFEVIEKALAAGLTLREVADAMVAEGYRINKGLLFWHLGVVRKERGVVKSPRARGQGKAKPASAMAPISTPVAPETISAPAQSAEPGAIPMQEPAAVSAPVAPAQISQQVESSDQISVLVQRQTAGVADEDLPQAVKDKLYVEIEGEMLDVRKDLPPRFTPVDNSFRSNPRPTTKEDMEALRKEKAIIAKFNRARLDYVRATKDAQAAK